MNKFIVLQMLMNINEIIILFYSLSTYYKGLCTHAVKINKYIKNERKIFIDQRIFSRIEI